jgi:predicted Zn-dependent peptidase
VPAEIAVRAATTAALVAVDPSTAITPSDGGVTISVSELASGIRVVSEAVPGARSVCSGVWVGVGARDESDELAGVSHFLEHLLFKGTPTRSSTDIARAIDRVGGDMNAFTTEEYTAYYTRLPSEHLGVALELLGDVVCSPALRDGDVESERQVILEELAAADDSPDDRVHALLTEQLFPGHPLGRETAGDRSVVASLAPQQVRDFFNRWYRPSNMVVAVAGDLEHEAVLAAVDRWGLEPSVGIAPHRERPGVSSAVVRLERRSTEQVHVALGYRALSRHHPDREVLEVANHVLGGGMSSRLFDEIRERRGLVYTVFSIPSFFADDGTMSVYAGTSPDHVTEVLACMATEIERIAQDGITAEECEVAIGYLTGSYVLGLEDAASRMSRLGGQLTVLGTLTDVDEQLDRYRAVTAEQVQTLSGRVFGGTRSLAAVGPVSMKALSARK